MATSTASMLSSILLMFLWHKWLARAQHVPGRIWAFLDCDGHPAWKHFRQQMGPSYREAGFPANSALAAEADGLLIEHLPSVDLYSFYEVLSEPSSPDRVRRDQDCAYGVVAALFVRGREFVAMGDVASALADWELALRFLGKELGLDFLESTSWGIRSADILLAHHNASGSVNAEEVAVLPAELQNSLPPATSDAKSRALHQGPRAVDPLCAVWAPGTPIHWPSMSTKSVDLVMEHLNAKQLEIAVYGYHPVLIEPIAVLMLPSQNKPGLLRTDRLRWYGVTERDCAFFSLMCNEDTRRETRSPVPGNLRFKAYESESDVEEVAAAYKAFWEVEKSAGLAPHVFLCMELRDAYFLWRVTGVATIYYPAIIFFQDEAMSDFACSVYLRQFDEMRRNDVLSAASSLSRHGGPPVAMVAQSPYLAESIAYHTQSRLPSVRPLALYVGTKYSPNSTVGGGGGSLLVLCARTRLMMSHSCRGLFRESRRLLPSATRVRLRLPPGDSDVVHGFSFEEVATFDATVLVPWNIAVTTFTELYAMHMPMFVPDSLWLARLWPKQMTSYGRAHPNMHRELREPAVPARHPTPYPSMDSVARDFPAMLYWAEHYAHIHELPGVRSFTSIPALLWSLHHGHEDLTEASAAMRSETLRAFEEVMPFWAYLLNSLTSS